MIAFDQTKPLLKAFASAGVDTKKLYFVAGLSNRFENVNECNVSGKHVRIRR